MIIRMVKKFVIHVLFAWIALQGWIILVALTAMLKLCNYLLQALLFCLPSRDCCHSSSWSAGKPHGCFHAAVGKATGSWEGSGCAPCRHLYDRKLGRTSRSVTSYLPRERSQRDLELLQQSQTRLPHGRHAQTLAEQPVLCATYAKEWHSSGTRVALIRSWLTSALRVWQSLPFALS